MKRSDIWFFSVIGLTILILFTEIIGQLEFGKHQFFFNIKYLTFWWVLLLPYIFINLFFRNSKLFKWLNTEIKIY